MTRAIVNIYIERSRNFQKDMTSINSRDDVLTLLVHLGDFAFGNIDPVIMFTNKYEEVFKL